ncbi:hypothetical protein F5Y16DRAFT_393551 [Xylariaceae sp. FL0255]|nr:hypothetical protein F5Y16DRAFT_393551 [Xylariaceae sp. FL0255]
MESFSLAAQHAGSIQHIHVIKLDASAIAVAREMRIAVTVIMAGLVAVYGLRTLFGRHEARTATRPHFEQFARSEFDKHIKIEKRDFAAIEYLLRKGRRQLETYSASGIKDIRA